MRAVKYSMLFILLSLFVVYIFEVTSKRFTHYVQYGVVHQHLSCPVACRLPRLLFVGSVVVKKSGDEIDGWRGTDGQFAEAHERPLLTNLPCQ